MSSESTGDRESSSMAVFQAPTASWSRPRAAEAAPR